MAEVTEQIGTQLSGFAQGAGDFFQVIIPLIFISLLLLGLLWWYLEQKKYNKHVRILRASSDNRVKWYNDKAKYYKNKDGVDGWRLKKLKHKIEVPPDDCLETNINGSTLVHCILDSNNQVTWVKVNVNYKDYKEHGITFEPITTQSKSNYAYQQQYNKKLRMNGIKENVPLIVGGITLVIILMVTLFFLPETFEAAKSNSEAQAQAASEISKAINSLNDVITNQQRIIDNYETYNAAEAQVNTANLRGGG